jgi:hypothetical protein
MADSSRVRKRWPVTCTNLLPKHWWPHSNYEVVIVGQDIRSEGGVATHLDLLWARIPLFVSRHVQAISYASPCVVCKDIFLKLPLRETTSRVL